MDPKEIAKLITGDPNIVNEETLFKIAGLDMDPKDLAKLINEDPDLINETKVKCRGCGRYSDDKNIYCPICSWLLTQSKTPTMKTQPTTAVSVDDFDWIRFKDDISEHGEHLTVGDFPDDSNTILETVFLYSKKPMPTGLDFYNAKFVDELANKVHEACTGEYWEIEEETQPMGYHGTFRVTEMQVDLNDAQFEEVSDVEQDDNGEVKLHITISAPFKGRSYKDSLA